MSTKISGVGVATRFDLQTPNRRKGERRDSCPVSCSPFHLLPYQIKKGIHYFRRVNGCGALFWSMRLRKTRVVIRYLMQCKDAKRILIVGPYSVLPGWHEQLAQDNIQNYVVYGDTKYRKEFFENNKQGGWYLINKEAYLQVNILSYHWDAVVLDESTFIAEPTAKVTKYFMGCSAKYRIILTGTPAPENPIQYFCQLYFINPDILGYKNYWTFRAERFRLRGYDWQMAPKDKLWLMSRINKYCSVLKRGDVGLEKEKIFDTRYIQLNKAHYGRYLYIEENAMMDNEVLKFAGSRWNECRKLCGGEEKLQELKYLVTKELLFERIVIYAWYVEEVNRIAKELKIPFIHGKITNKAKREDIRLSFQSKKSRMVVIQPETSKFGQDFSSATVAIFFSLPPGLLTNQQVMERTENLFTDNKTLFIYLIAQNTIEEDMLKSIHLKESNVAMLERILKSVQARMGI